MACRERGGEIVWLILLDLVGWALGVLFVLVLCRMAGSEDRAARHAEKMLDPFSDVHVIMPGT
jgi:hypothetical protein